MTSAFDEMARRVSNWGRWGKDDELGTLNLITSQVLTAAAQLIIRGASFSLSIPVGRDGPQTGARRQNPIHLMTDVHSSIAGGGPVRFSDDFLALYLQSGTQWDALSHVGYGNLLYNGVGADQVTSQGASRLAIDGCAARLAGRGVLLDLPRVRNVDWLEAGYVITPADLDASLEAQRVDVRSGDILLIRTGWRRRFVVERSRAAFMSGEPGLGVESAAWLRDRDVAVVCSDNYAIEAIPGEEGVPPLAVHMLLIRDMGMTLGEIFDLEELAEDCASDGRYEFFFCGPPLRIEGGVGSPVNPLAIK